MANEYNELEQLVNDVTNIDTARMTLRWALERLNSIEKERAELKKTLAITEDTRKTLEVKVQSLEESFKSRGKSLEEKEGFYSKLEATMALLGDGKLDIQQLLKKEARLDHARLELEREFQDKFEELDRNQNSVIARWNQRLLDVESQYAKRLSESQTRYDSLRQELEADYQGRLGTLEHSYQLKEKELTERIKALETSVKAGGNALEGRRKEIETEFLAKKNEIEGNYLKLKSLLETGFQERIHSMENDHCAQVRSLEKTWNAERERLMAEQHARDEQFEKSQKEMTRLEAQLSGQQEQHHRELIELISKKEEAFRGKVADLEKEKAAYEKAAEHLTMQLENKEKDWIAQKGQLQADFARRIAEIEASAMERALAFENDGAARNEGMEKLIAASKEEFAREASARVEEIRREMEEEKGRLVEDNTLKALALGRAAEMIRELEVTLASSNEDHHKELLVKIRSNEEAFRAKLAEFEAEKEGYKAAIAGLTETAGKRDSRFIEETERIQKEFSDKYAQLEAKAAADASKDKAVYDGRLAALMSSFGEKEKNWVLEREKMSNELAAISNGTQALASERVEKIKAAYESRKAELEKQFEEKLAAASSALAFEKAQMVSDLKTASEQYTRLTEQFKELESTIAEDRRAHHEEVMGKLAEKESALKAQAEKFGKELVQKDELAAQVAAEAAAKETAWMEEKKSLSGDFAARFQLLEEGLARRESVLENQYRLKAAELEKNAAEVRELMEADFHRRVAVEKQAFENAKARLSDESRIKGEQLAEARAQASERVEKIRAVYEIRKADLEKQLEERLAAAAGALAFEKARLLADLKTASEEYTKLSDQFKELEGTIVRDRQLHHEELMKYMSDKEAALKNQTDNFNKETLKLREEISAREAAWLSERENLRAEAVEAGARAVREADERAVLMARNFENKKAELERILSERLAEKEATLRLETAKILEASRLKDGRLGAAHERVKELENQLNAMSGAHHEELAARLAEKETALKAQAAELRREKESALEQQAADLNGELEKTRQAFSVKESFLAEKTEKLSLALKETAARAEREIKDRSAIMAAEYENRKAELERMLGERMQAASTALAFEKSRLLADLKTASVEYTKLSEKLKELESTIAVDRQLHHDELMRNLSEKEAALKNQADNFAREALKSREEMGAREAAWLAERKTLRAAAAESGARAERETAERAASLAKEYENKKAELERILGERLAAKEAVLRLETSKIMEESRLKDERLAATHSRVKELENKLNAMSGAHHEELAVRLAEKEAALKAQVGNFEKEVKGLLSGFEAKEASWTKEKAELGTEFAARLLSVEKEMAARESVLQEQYRLKEAEIGRHAAESLKSSEVDFTRRLAAEKSRFEEAKSRLDEESDIKNKELASTHGKVKELEKLIGGLKDAHHAELMAAQEEKEAVLRTQAASFNSEMGSLRDTYNAKMSFQAREKDAALKAQTDNFNKELNSLRESFASKEAFWSREKDKSSAALAETAARADRELKAHSAQLAAEYEHKKAELERILNERLAEKEAVLKLETSKILEASRLKDEQLAATHSRVKELENRLNAMSGTHHQELMARLAEKEAALKAQADSFNKEKAAVIEARVRSSREELAALSADFAAREAAWKAEHEKAEAERAELSAAADREAKAREARLAAEYESKKAEVERQFNEKYASASEALAFERARLAADLKTANGEYAKLAEHLKELEDTIAADRQAHHSELMSKLADKETALKVQAGNFEKELNSLRESMADKDELLSLEKEKANEALAETSARADRELKAHSTQLAAEYEYKKAELERILNERLAEKEAVLKLETSKILEASRLKDEQLAATHSRVKELENRLNAMSGTHHQELMARLAEKEAALKAQADSFNKEKAAVIEARDRSSREELAALSADFAAREAAWKAEHEKAEAERAELSAAADREAKAREARLAAEYENKKAELEKRFEEKYASASGALAFEKSRLISDLKTASSEYTKLAEHLKELEDTIAADRQTHRKELMEKLSDKETALKAQSEAFNMEMAKLREGFESEKARLASEGLLKEERLSAAYAQLGDLEKRSDELKGSYKEELAARLKEKDDDFSSKIAALEADHAARREALAAGLAAKEDSLNKEAAARIGFERSTWQAQQTRLETMLANTAADFRKAQKEIESLSASVSAKDEENVRLRSEMSAQAGQAAEALRSAANEAVARKSAGLEAAYKERKERLETETAALKKELQSEHEKRAAELAANYEAGLRRAALENEALRTAAARTHEESAALQVKADAYMNEIMDKEHTHQTEMLRLKETLSRELEARLAEAAEKAVGMQQDRVRFLEKELSRIQQDNADALRTAEDSFRKEKERLAGELGRRQDYISLVDQKLREMEADLVKSRQNTATAYLVQIAEQDEKFKTLIGEYEARQEKLEAEASARVEAAKKEGEDRQRALEDRFEAAEKLAREEKEAQLRREAELEARNLELSAKLHRLGEELRGREGSLAELEAHLEEVMEKNRLQKTESLKLKEAHASELAARVSDAAADAASPLLERMRALEQELLAQRQRNESELAARESDFKREKERLSDELSRRDSYLETADLKSREMEEELLKVRQNASAVCLSRITEQDERFKAMMKEYEVRQDKLEKDAAVRMEELRQEYESRLRDMEEMLRSKDGLVRQGGDFWRQKQAELDAQHSALNMKINAFNEELFAQRQALSERENVLNAQQLEREKGLAARMSEIQKLKVELTKTIAEYKSRK